MKKAFEKIYDKPWKRALITAVLTIVLSVFIGMFGTFDLKQPKFIVKLIHLIVTAVLYVVHLAISTTKDSKEKAIADEYKRQVDVCEKALIGIITICQTSANQINDALHNKQKSGEFNNDLWNYKRQCYSICDTLLIFIKGLINDKNVEISYVKLNEDKDGEISLFAYSNNYNQPPTLLNRIRNFKNETEVQYYDMQLFNKNKSDVDILLNTTEINDNFYLRADQRKKSKNKYSQYIAIPIYCNNEKMIGLLQVTFFEGSKLSDKKEVVLEMANKYFVPYANLFLLFHKVNKITKLNNEQLKEEALV